MGGHVKVVFNGVPELEDIKIDDEAMEYSASDIAKAVKDATKEAMKEAQKQAADKMKGMMGGMGLNLPGM